MFVGDERVVQERNGYLVVQAFTLLDIETEKRFFTERLVIGMRKWKSNACKHKRRIKQSALFDVDNETCHFIFFFVIAVILRKR